MATNQYLPFATGVGANTLSYATYSVNGLVASGHVPGIALSEVMNTTLRQATVGVAGLAKFMTDYGLLDAMDDGNVANFALALKSAIDQLLSAQQFWKPGDIKASMVNATQAGWLKANGAIVSRTTYAALFAAIGTTYNVSPGISGSDFQLPDNRGIFLRGFDDGRGVDSSRQFGVEQLDALQNIIGYLGVDDRIAGNLAIGAFRANISTTNEALAAGAPNADTTAGGGDGVVRYAKFDASLGGARTATETRARNQTALFLIKT